MCVFVWDLLNTASVIIIIIIPILQGSSFKIEISFYEIYNEKIHDLLASTNKKNRSHVSLYGCELNCEV